MNTVCLTQCLLIQLRAAQHASAPAEPVRHTLTMKAMATAPADGDPVRFILRILAHDAEIVGQRVLDWVQLQRIDCWLWRDAPIRKDELTSHPVRVCTVKCGELGDVRPCCSFELWAVELGRQPRAADTPDSSERVRDVDGVHGAQPPLGDFHVH